MLHWQSQEAKAKFSELVRLAQDAPQVITVRGEEEAVMVSKELYDQLTSSNLSCVEFMRQSPLCEEDIDFERDLFISVITIGEIRKGVEKVASSQKKHALIQWLEVDIVKWFGDRILNIDKEVSDKWGYLTGNVKRPLPAIDSLIAATALTHNLVLVTRNTKDFADIIGLEIVDPWA